jgi:hypothetical protein
VQGLVGRENSAAVLNQEEVLLELLLPWVHISMMAVTVLFFFIVTVMAMFLTMVMIVRVVALIAVNVFVAVVMMIVIMVMFVVMIIVSFFFMVMMMVVVMISIIRMLMKQLVFEIAYQCVHLDRWLLLQELGRQNRGNALKCLVVAEQVEAIEDVRGPF